MDKKIKDVLKKYSIRYCIMVIFFMITLFLVSVIPSKYMKQNVKESADIFMKEGNDKYVVVNDINKFKSKQYIYKIDNYTDSLMVNTAYSIDYKEPIKSFLLARKNFIPGVTEITHKEVNGNLQFPSKYEKYTPAEELYDTVNDNIDESYEYARYWHGYLVLLRPLLFIFNINQIRILSQIIFAVLLLFMGYLIWKKIDPIIAIIVEIAFLSIQYYLVAGSFQGNAVLLLSIISTIYILLRNDKIKSFSLMFFTIGRNSQFCRFFNTPTSYINHTANNILFIRTKKKQL